MTLEGLASLFNMSGFALVLLVSLVVMRYHRRPYFTYWVWAGIAGEIMLLCEFLASQFGRALVLDATEVLATSVCVWLYLIFARLLRGARLPLAWGVAWLAIAMGSYGWLAAHGYPFLVSFVVAALGLAVAQIACGVAFLDVPTPAGRTMAWQAWPQILLGAWTFMYPVLQPTRYFWVGYLVAALLHVLIGISILVFVLEDVAALLAKRNRELIEAAAHKHTFLSMVSHELRTPLAANIGYHELLEDALAAKANATERDYMDRMRQSAGQLNTLIEALLDTVQLENGTLSVHQARVDLGSTLVEALGPLQALVLGKALQLALDVPEGLPPVLGDPRRIVQVVNNLVANAAKFTQASGRIDVQARLAESHVRVEVADTGVGIAADQLPHVFDAFFQADNSLTRRYGGSGLGLAIVRELVGRMGGSVGVESEPGRGSRFWFTLPLAEPMPAELAA